MLDLLMLSQSQRNSMEAAAAAYEKQMTWEAASYLEARGIDQAAANGSRLGFVAQPEVGHEPYRGRLVIPYLTPSGVVSLRFRAITDAKPKYMGLPGAPTRLYNARVLASFVETVVICEGELDALVMTEKVGVPAVGVPGIQNWKPHYSRCFADVPRVIVCFDNDSTKEENHAQEIAKKIVKQIPGSVNIAPPDGLDLNEWYLTEGPGAIRKSLGLEK